jgi:hypothetical protein
VSGEGKQWRKGGKAAMVAGWRLRGGGDAGCLRAGPARRQSLAAGEGEGRCEKGEEGVVGKTMTVERRGIRGREKDRRG